MKRLYVMVTVGTDGQVKDVNSVDTASPTTRIGDSALMSCFLPFEGDNFGELERNPISAGERQLINAVFAAFTAVAEVGLTSEQRRRILELAPKLQLVE